MRCPPPLWMPNTLSCYADYCRALLAIVVPFLHLPTLCPDARAPGAQPHRTRPPKSKSEEGQILNSALIPALLTAGERIRPTPKQATDSAFTVTVCGVLLLGTNCPRPLRDPRRPLEVAAGRCPNLRRQCWPPLCGWPPQGPARRGPSEPAGQKTSPGNLQGVTRLPPGGERLQRQRGLSFH